MQGMSVGWILRSSQAFFDQLCARETLQYGIAFYSERYAALADGAQFREVLIEEPARVPDAFAEAEAFFAARAMTCHRWTPAMGAAPPGLAEFLAARGFAARPRHAYLLTQWVERPVEAGIRVLPARAMRSAFERLLIEAPDTAAGVPTAQDAGTTLPADLATEAWLERLDEPQMDVTVALVQGRPAGRCVLFQTGDIVRVLGPAVAPAHANDGVAEALLAHALATARRLALAHVCTQLDAADTAGHRLFESFGFVRDGVIEEFERSP